MSEKNSIKIFEQKEVRTVWDEEQEKWFVSVVDVIAILTESVDPSAYWRKLKQRLKAEGNETVTDCHGLKMKATDGKMRLTDVADTEQIFRLIQSIPSPKAEPFKKWLAKVGYERVQEIENPELAQERMKKIYEQKGYPKEWIDKRIRGIAIRQNLTDEWRERGIKEHRDFAILTAEISRATFGMTPSEYKNHKNLPEESKANLRDHMDDLELIFTMLGERVTTEISKKEEPDTFSKNKNVAKRGGSVAGNARKETEKELGRTVVSTKNYLEKEDKTLLSEIEDKS